MATKAVEASPAAKGTLDDVVRTLEGQREAAQSRLDELDGERKRLAGEVERIGAAIAALKGGKASRSKPAAVKGYTTAEVGEVVAEALRAGPAGEAELKAKLDEHAQAHGRNRAGLHLRLRDALKASRFTQAGGKWTLA